MKENEQQTCTTNANFGETTLQGVLCNKFLNQAFKNIQILCTIPQGILPVYYKSGKAGILQKNLFLPYKLKLIMIIIYTGMIHWIMWHMQAIHVFPRGRQKLFRSPKQVEVYGLKG